MWQWRSRAHTTVSFFRSNEHLHDMKTTTVGKERKKKKEDEPTCHWSAKSNSGGSEFSTTRVAEGTPEPACLACGRSWERNYHIIFGQHSGRHRLAPEEVISKSLLLHSANRPFKRMMGEVKRGRICGKSYSSKTTFLRTGEETSFIFAGNFSWLVMIANLRITKVCSPAKATWDLPTRPPILTHGTMAAVGHTHQALSECRNTRPLPSESEHYSQIWRCKQTTLPKKPIDSSSCMETFHPRIAAKHRKDWTMGWTWAMAQKNSTA